MSMTSLLLLCSFPFDLERSETELWKIVTDCFIFISEIMLFRIKQFKNVDLYSISVHDLLKKNSLI